MVHRINPSRDITLECFTVSEFCAAHRIGLRTYYQIKKAQLGPDEMRVGSRVLITKESAARWRAARDAEAKSNKTSKAEQPSKELDR